MIVIANLQGGAIFVKILIKGGHIVDPDTKVEDNLDILIEEGTIKKVEKSIKDSADKVIDAKGCYVFPGFIDLHVHLRDPGLTHKEDIITGANAAAKGGFTTIVAMPNTKPVIDDKDRVKYVHNKAKDHAKIHVLQSGAITKGQKGEELADIEGMIEAGIPAITEDGKSVMDAGLYKQAMEIAAKHNVPVFAHCEDITMVHGGCMNADEKAEEFGLPGITNSVEDVIVARDIILARDTGARLHLCHCSTATCVPIIRDAQKVGIEVTAEVCPHHFTLSTEDMVKEDTNYKMNPPLRKKEDVEGLKKGLKEGVFNIISTDHAPHSLEEKQMGMRKAPFGIVGLETALGLTVTELVDKGYLTPMQMAEYMSYNPARVIGLDKGSLAVGKVADIVIVDMDEEYVVHKEEFESKGKNTPFDGRKVKGKVKTTICDGLVVYEE